MLCEEKGARLRVAPIDDAGELDLDGVREAPRRPARRIVAVAHVSNALGTVIPVEPDRRARARARRRPSWSTARRPRRTCRSTSGRSTATSTPSRATRSTARPGIGVLYGKARAARGDAAVPGRRRHDPLGHLREDDLQRAALQVRGRHAEHRRRHRPRRRDRLRRRRSASTAIARARARAPRPTRPTRSRRSRACASSAPRARRRASSPSSSTASTRTTSARSSTARASRSAPATTARSR